MQLPAKITTLLKSLLNSEVATQESLLQVTDLPDWGDLLNRGNRLPGQYAARFQPDPLTDGHALHGREVELASLNEVLARWESGRACSVAVIGPEGSGKTSLLNCFVAETATRHPTLMAQLNQRVACLQDLLGMLAEIFGVDSAFTSVNELVRYILARPRQVFVLEYGHNLTLRQTGCREALQAFFHILIETRHHWLWVVSFRRYPWERLLMTAAIAQYFTHQVTTLYHDQQQLRHIIEKRHAATGLGLEFLAAENSQQSQEVLAESFYRNLFAATGGNVAAAFYYWLLSLAEDGSAETIRIMPLGSVDADYLRSLDRSYHFTLAEIIWHGYLSCQEHQHLFMLSREASRLQLEYLEQLSLVEADGIDEDGFAHRYRLNPAYFKPVIELLESLHLIY